MSNEVEKVRVFYKESVSLKDFYGQADYFNLNDDLVIQEEVNIFSLNKGDSVLEIGSGYGRLVPEIQSRGVSYRGIDFVDEYVFFCKNRFPKVRFDQVDFFSHCFDEKYDRIIFPWTVLGHYSFYKQKNAILKACSLLKSGGKIYVSFRSEEEIALKDYPKGSVVEKSNWGLKIELHLVGDENKKLLFFNSNKLFFKHISKELDINVSFKELDIGDSRLISYAVISEGG